MYGKNDKKVYVRFRDEELEDIDDNWNLEVEWAGGATFNIYSDGKNVDCFTRYGDNQGSAPTFDQAWDFVVEFFDETKKELISIVSADNE
jgi:hypothetical protein